jgi:RNA polymerase sigma-70 factor (ECF subfamily)
VQEAFISAFKSIHSFESGSRLSTWLHRIAVNACLMRLRSRKAMVSVEELIPTFDHTGHHVRPVSRWADDTASLADAAEVRSIVRGCIDLLPEPYRVVLMLRDIEEFDTAETARLLNCTAANIKTRLHRARQALRTLLDSRLGLK